MKLFLFVCLKWFYFRADANQEALHANRDGCARRTRGICRSYLCWERENQDHSFLWLPTRHRSILKTSNIYVFISCFIGLTFSWFCFGNKFDPRIYVFWWRNGTEKGYDAVLFFCFHFVAETMSLILVNWWFVWLLNSTQYDGPSPSLVAWPCAS